MRATRTVSTRLTCDRCGSEISIYSSLPLSIFSNEPLDKLSFLSRLHKCTFYFRQYSIHETIDHLSRSSGRLIFQFYFSSSLFFCVTHCLFISLATQDIILRSRMDNLQDVNVTEQILCVEYNCEETFHLLHSK